MLKKDMREYAIREIRINLKSMYGVNNKDIINACFSSATGAINMAATLEIINDVEKRAFKSMAWQLYCGIRWGGLTKWN